MSIPIPQRCLRDPATLALGASALGAAVYLAVGTKPWQTGIARALAEKKPPALADALSWGFWWGAAAVAVVFGTLASTRRWWREARPATMTIPRLREAPVRLAWWWAALAVLLVATAAHRWPRMSHSFWGDESMAMADCVQGHYIPASPDRRLGPLKFKNVPWTATWFGDRQVGNNHYLFTVLSRACLERWRKWGGHARHEFNETAARLPALAGGLGLLTALALLGFRLGAPRAGLLGAVLMVLHPWHLRYSTEARGYSLMGMFLCLALSCLVTALETGTWSAWLLVAAMQFFTIYSCKIAVYPLALLNLAVAVALWRRRVPGQARAPGLARWFVANALAAVVFIVLYAPCHPQSIGATAMIQQRGQTQFSVDWWRDKATEAATGMPWITLDPDNPAQVTWEKIGQARPELGGAAGRIIAALALTALLLALAAGFWRLWRKLRPAAWAVGAVLMAAVLAALHFRYGLKIELLPWYWFFVAPPICLLAALGAASAGRWHWPAMLGLAGLMAAATWPLQRQMVAHPFEDFRGAVWASRGRHESPHQRTSSRVYTCWLWRSSPLYDPRGHTQVRTVRMLNNAIREAERAQAELYVIIGYPKLAQLITPMVFERVTTHESFEKVAEFPAQVPRHSLSVYRYVPQLPRRSGRRSVRRGFAAPRFPRHR